MCIILKKRTEKKNILLRCRNSLFNQFAIGLAFRRLNYRFWKDSIIQSNALYLVIIIIVLYKHYHRFFYQKLIIIRFLIQRN